MKQESISEEQVYGDPDRPAVPWGLREIGQSLLIILGLYLFVSLAILGPLSLAVDDNSAEFRFANIAVSALVEAGTAAGAIFLVLRSGGTLAQLGLRIPRAPRAPSMSSLLNPSGDGFPWGYTARLAILALVGAWLASFSYSVLIDAAGIGWLEPPRRQLEADYFDSAAVAAMVGFAVVIVAPITEEIYFRGFVFGGLRGIWGFLPAALVSGAFFSLAHFHIGLVVPFTMIGFIFAYLYQRSGSLASSMTTHFLFNLLSFLVLVFVPGQR